MFKQLNSRITALERASPGPMTRRQLIERARALSLYAGVPFSRAYIVVWSHAFELGKAPPNNIEHYFETVWRGDRDAFKAALMKCLLLLQARPDDPATMAEMLKLMLWPSYEELPKQSTSGESWPEVEQSEADLPTAA